MTTDDYKQLITSEYQDSTKFLAMIQAVTSAFVQIQNCYAEMIPRFDVDVAMGSQLDIIGLWVGFPRTLTIPVGDIFFSWDTVNLGWEQGIWQGDDNQTQVAVLPDDVYRNFIKAKIAANQWDGTTDGAYAIWDSVFTNINILIQDNQDMSFAIAFVGGILDALTIAVITSGLLPLKPEGVRISEYFFPVDTNPMFGWDLDSEEIAGWDEGSWARELAPT